MVKAQVNAKAWSRHLERNAQDDMQSEQLMNFRGNVNNMYNAIAVEREKTSSSNNMMMLQSSAMP